MARLVTSGAEIYLGTGSGTGIEGGNSGSAGVTRDTSTFRSGVAAWKVDSTGSNLAATNAWTFTGAAETFSRVYVNLTDLPSSTVNIVEVNGRIAARLDSSGNLTLWNVAGVAQIGSGTTALSTGTWYRIELRLKIAAGSTDEAELRVDGATVQASTSLNISDTNPTQVKAGWIAAPGASKVVYLDDVAVNDTSGSNQNSWPGDGKVVLLKPISDGQRGSWTGGAGGTTNLWDAVDNTPPVGTASETDTTQIESADTSPDNATDEYRPNMTTYTTAGVGASDTVNLVQAYVNHGEDVATGTKTGKFRLESNPAQTGGTYDTFTFGDDVGALGTWPTNWSWASGTVEYAPSVTLGNSPQVALRKTDTGSRVASVDFIGMYVDYTPAAAAAASLTPLLNHRQASTLYKL